MVDHPQHFEPELDVPQIVAALAQMRDATTNPEIKKLTKLMAHLCFKLIDIEEEIDEPSTPLSSEGV